MHPGSFPPSFFFLDACKLALTKAHRLLFLSPFSASPISRETRVDSEAGELFSQFDSSFKPLFELELMSSPSPESALRPQRSSASLSSLPPRTLVP